MNTRASKRAGSTGKRLEELTEGAYRAIDALAERYCWCVIFFTILWFGVHIVVAAARGLF